MTALRPLAVALAALLATTQTACVSKGKYAALESQYRALSEQVASLEASNNNLAQSHREAIGQLEQTETELASLDERYGAAQMTLADAERARGALRTQLTSLARSDGASPMTRQLSELSRTYPSLRFDPNTGISKLQTDVLFEEGSEELTPQGKRLVTQLTSIFMSPAAKDLRIMVVGHTDDQQVSKRTVRDRYPNNWHLSSARALAVADALRRAGFPEDRMGVAAYAGHQPIAVNDSPEDRGRNRRVEIFLMGPETPVVGWTETTPTVYR